MKPFQPSQLSPLGGVAIDATTPNLISWKFFDPNQSDVQSSFYIEWKESLPFSTTLIQNTTIGATYIIVTDATRLQKNYTITIGSGASLETRVINNISGSYVYVPALTYAHNINDTITLVASNTGWITSSVSNYTFPANTFVNGKNLAWRIKYKDNNLIESDFSDWCIFKTSTRPTCSITFPINDNDIVVTDIPTFTHTFADVEGQPQLNYQYKIYADDGTTLLWTSELKTDNSNLIVPPKGLLLNNTYYKVNVTVTDNDGLTATSTFRRFFTNYKSPSFSAEFFTVTPDSNNANINLKWNNIQHIIANYKGSGVRYKPAKFSNGVEVSEHGEKLYWNINIPEIFTLKGNYTPNSTTIGDIIFLYKNDYNYLRFNYDEITNKFYVEKNVNGNIRTYGSPTVTITAGQSFSFAIKQNFTGLYIYTLVNGVLNQWGDL